MIDKAIDAAVREAGKPLADLTGDEVEALAGRVFDHLVMWDFFRMIDGRLRGGARLLDRVYEEVAR